MKRKQMIRDWMLAHIRMECRGDCSAWSDDEVYQSFIAIRSRVMPFDEWAEILGEDTKEDMTQEDIERVNESALAIIKHDNHKAVKVA